jgi:membrane-bound lytic murein transglycosylase B
MSKFWSITRNLALLATAALLTTPFATAQTLGKAELKKLIATASTPQDHERIAKHYDAKAVQLEAEAKEHDELAASYKANPNMHEMKHPTSPQTASHCEAMARSTRAAAKEARELAEDHREMAKPTKAK